jgi:hypothetical protein
MSQKGQTRTKVVALDRDRMTPVSRRPDGDAAMSAVCQDLTLPTVHGRLDSHDTIWSAHSPAVRFVLSKLSR